MVKIKQSDLKITRKTANDYAEDINGYNGLFSILNDDNGDFSIMIDYKLYHNSGIASLGLVGTTIIRTTSLFLLESQILNEMRTTYKDSRGNKSKNSEICLFRII